MATTAHEKTTFRHKWHCLLRKLKLNAQPNSNVKHGSVEQVGGYDVPESFSNLDEIAAPAPIENRDENAEIYHHHTLEEQRG